MRQAQPKRGLETGGLQTGNLSNPLDDLRDFAKDSMDRHGEKQNATRKEAAATNDRETKRTFVQPPPLKGFATSPQGVKRKMELADEGPELRFDVLLKKSGTSPNFTYEVGVTRGYVSERIPGEGDAMGYFEPSNILDGDDEMALFAIADSEAIYVVVEQQGDGTIGGGEGDGPVYLAVEADDEESIHYQPQVDTDSTAGVAGTMYYKLASLAIDSGVATLTKYMAGSNIDQYQELPKIKSTIGIGEGIGVIPKKWDNAAAAYKMRALSVGLGELGITTNSDEVEVRGNKIGNEFAVYKGDDPESLGNWEFRDGLLLTGQTIEGGEDPPVEIDPILEIKIPIVEARADALDAPAQIKVTPTGVKDSTYVVEGNGVNTYLELTRDGTPVATLTYVDGLLSAPVDVSVEVGGDGLPKGFRGQVLVHDGTGWVPLAKPAEPESPNRNFLTHDGDMPSWVELEGTEIQICESGTPVTKIIYTEP